MGSSPSIHDVNAEYTERIAVVIQSSLLSSQSTFVVNLEDVLRTHFARHGAQVYQLIAATDAARLHSTQECQRALPLWVQTTAFLGEQSRLSAEDETRQIEALQRLMRQLGDFMQGSERAFIMQNAGISRVQVSMGSTRHAKRPPELR